MAFKESVTIRDEVLWKEIYGIVRLYRLEEKGTLENDPQRFLDITFPTFTLHQLLTSVIRKLTGKEQRGTFAVTGGGGSGKSHILVTLTHLLKRGPDALKWLEANKIERADQLSEDSLVLPYQLVAEGGPVTKLWAPLLESLGQQKDRHGWRS
jgi:predicted AAA+ superfamily ATPase